MIVTKKALPRRTVLRGIGTSVALPLLDAMVPAMTARAATPASPVRRLGYIYVPMGSDVNRWTPPREDTLADLSPILRPIEPHKDHVTVLSNMELRNAYPGTHATSNSAYLSCAKAKLTESTDYYLGTTVDQIAAKEIGQDTPIPSLELGMDMLDVVGQCDDGFACVYQNNLSWSSPTTPLPYEAHPRNVFNRLFGEGTPEQRARALRKKASMLDRLRGDIARLRRELGTGDLAKVEQYLDSVREVERRIQIAEDGIEDAPQPDIDRPAGVPAKYADHVRLMFDLQVLAMQADLTRIITFQLAREGSTRSYPEVGVTEPHHPLTHHGNNPELVAKVAKINEYHVSLFAYLLDRLKSTADGDGSLLDHCMYLYGSGMGDPNKHDHVNLPIMVAGGGAGRLKGGRHIRYERGTPLANLHLTLLEKVGVRMESFADSHGKVEELLSI
ncbi:MAG: DUF1552 domain-containing protein [Bryobacterales bacterium]|nr:DUF1552 domain-containing protein [Bryobacterales bacterium]